MINTPSGPVQVTVPPGLVAGQTFQVQLPPVAAVPASYAPVQASYAQPAAPPQASYAQPAAPAQASYAQTAASAYPANMPAPGAYPGAVAAASPAYSSKHDNPSKPEYNEVELIVVAAKGLHNADGGGIFSSGKSDPYCIVKDVKGLIGSGGKTPVVKNSLSPEWNSVFRLKFNYKLSEFKFKVKDYDGGKLLDLDGDDPLGKATLSIAGLMDQATPGQPVLVDRWLPLRKPEQGELHVRAKVTFHIPLALPGYAVRVPGQLKLGLAWEFKKKGAPLDLDASVVGLDAAERIVDVVSYKQLVGFGGAVRHSGDDRTGEGSGDDETIAIAADALPPYVEKLAVVINSFTGLKLDTLKFAYCRVIVGGRTHAFYGLTKERVPHQCTGLFLGVLQRATSGGWAFITCAERADGRTVQESLPAVLALGKAKLGW